jgi:hypothetical protein
MDKRGFGRLESVLIARHEGDFGTQSREFPGGGPSYAFAGAADDGVLACEINVHNS